MLMRRLLTKEIGRLFSLTVIFLVSMIAFTLESLSLSTSGINTSEVSNEILAWSFSCIAQRLLVYSFVFLLQRIKVEITLT